MNYLEQIGLFGLDWSSRVTKGVLDSTKIKTKLLIVTSFVSTVLLSCSVDNEYNFKNAEEAIAKYQSYASELHEKSSCTTVELIDGICHWQELSDTVYNYISRDSLFAAHAHLSSNFAVTGDSIRTCLLRLSDSMDRSYGDILLIKDRTNPFRNDTTLLLASVDALSFYDSFGNINLRQKDRDESISSYREYLAAVVSEGIHTNDELYRFIKLEDVLFRGFLEHLSEYGEQSLSDITSDTESICRQIYESANSGELNSKEVMVMLAVRTNRRLIQNAQVCIEDIRKGRVKTDAMLAAYQWMIIQPFVTMDGFSVALLTDQQKEQLATIASEFQQSLLSSKHDDATIKLMKEELPKQILKLYIFSL